MSLREDLTKLRNILITGSVGTVNWSNSLNPNLAVNQIVNYLTGNGVAQVGALFPMRYNFAPADASLVALLAVTNQTAAVQQLVPTAQPDFARFLQIKGGVAGQAGNVVVTGTDYNGVSVSDTIALSGTNAVSGVRAFKTVTKIQFPAQTHTPVLQKETATAAGTITGDGNATVIITADGMTGSPKTKSVAVLNNDLAASWATKVRSALTADADVTALFTVGGSGAAITLERKTPAANDGTLNISLDNGTCTGITTAAASANTTAGVAYDTISVGYINTFGFPQKLKTASMVLTKLFDGSADAGTVTVHADLSKNVFALAGTPDGAKLVDLTYLV